MKQLLSLFVILFGSSSFASTATVEIKIDAEIRKVTVSGKSGSFEMKKTYDQFWASQVELHSQNLDVNPKIASGPMKKEKFLDSEHYPVIYVRQLQCIRENKQCSLTLQVKGISKTIQARLVENGSATQIKFNFLLSDFNISQKIHFWKIDNTAEATVELSQF